MKKQTIIICISLFLFSCAENNWDKVLKENSIESYKKFIADNPESEFLNTAKFKLDSLVFVKDQTDWDIANKTNTKESFEYYVSENPEGKYYLDAKKNIEYFIDDEIWEKIDKLNSIDEYCKFISKYPNNRNIGLANEKVDKYLKNTFFTEHKDVYDFIQKVSKNKKYYVVKNFINGKLIYNDSTACFGVSGPDCDKNIQTIIKDSVSYYQTSIEFAFECLVSNIENGGYEKTYYDYDGTELNTELIEYEFLYLENGIIIKVYENYSDFTFTFIRKNNKLFLTEILAYFEETDV